LEVGDNLGAGGFGDVSVMSPRSRGSVCRGCAPLVAKRSLKAVEFTDDPESRKALRDACVAHALAATPAEESPPPVVPVVDARLVQGHLLVLMGHGGTSLEARLAGVEPLKELFKQGPTPQVLRTLANVAAALYHIALGIDRMHDLGVLHCDLKPDNVVVQATGTSLWQARLIDFDLARRPSVRIPGFLRPGTQWWMSPDYAKYDLEGPGCQQESDIWALGMMLYAVAHGAAGPSELRHLPDNCDTLCWRQAIQRFHTAFFNESAGHWLPAPQDDRLAAASGSINAMLKLLLATDRGGAVAGFKGLVGDARRFAKKVAQQAVDAGARFAGGGPPHVGPPQLQGPPPRCAASLRKGSSLWEYIDSKTVGDCLDAYPLYHPLTEEFM